MISLILNNWGKITFAAIIAICLGVYFHMSNKIDALELAKTSLQEEQFELKQVINQKNQYIVYVTDQQNIIESKLSELNQINLNQAEKLRSAQNEITKNREWINLNNVIKPNWLFYTAGESMSALSDAAKSINAESSSRQRNFASRTSAGINQFINQCYAEINRCNLLRETIESMAVNYNQNILQ